MPSDTDRSNFFPMELTTRQKIGGGVVVFALIAGLALLLRDFGGQANAQVEPDVIVMPVTVQRVVQVDSFHQKQRYSGIIRPRRSSELAFENGGLLTEVLADEGQSVSQGQNLATVDSATLRSRRAVTTASLNRARAQLAELNAGPRIEKINAAKANVKAARSQYQNASYNLERRKRLKATGAVSQEEYDRAVFEQQSALEALNAVTHQLQELEAGSRIEQIQAAKATVAEFEAAVSEIDVAISKSKLLAPFDGTITQRYLDIGSVANPGVPVYRLLESQKLEAWIGIPVDMANQFDTDSTVKIFVGDQEFYAKFNSRIREIDSTTRTQTVVFDMEAYAAKSLVAGQICKIEVDHTTRQTGIWVPTTSLTSGVRGLWSVMAVEQDQDGFPVAAKRDVEILFSELDRAFVRGTLQSGELVITDGLHRVVDGQRIELVQPGPQDVETRN